MSKKANTRSEASNTIMVSQGHTMSYNELMNVPKAQLIKEKLTVPDNRTRFILDVDNQTQKGKDIIALMNRLQAEDPKATKAVGEILGSLAYLVGESS